MLFYIVYMFLCNEEICLEAIIVMKVQSWCFRKLEDLLL